MRLNIDSFEAFVVFFFENGANAFRSESGEEPDLSFQPSDAVAYYRQLFECPSIVEKRYTRQQLDKGFGAMIDCNVPMFVTDLVWTSDVRLPDREALIRSMASLYRELFDRDALFGTPFMWWDVITYDFECGNRTRDESDEARRLQDCMFETLLEVLALPSNASQKAALHGLGHLHHPKINEAIAMYLAGHPALPPELAAYARQSAAGLIQ
jgi:hypothetical protein